MGEGERAKSGALWIAIIGIWALATGVLIVRLLPDILRSPATAFLVACLSFFVLSGVFNLVVNVFSHFLRDRPAPADRPGEPAVAVLYCTYNDFDRRAGDSLLHLTYPNARVWILDDSRDARVRDEVDAFARDAAGAGRPVEVVRRPARRGYKAGAINDALQRLPPEVRYVAIVDSDELVTPDFIQGCLRHFTREDVGFVQASHTCYNRGASWFTAALGIGVDLHWRHYQRYRNRYGTVNMLGHGAVVRRDVLERVGGFPEVTCEDIAFTVTARMAGYRGAFAADVVCGETFPEDFAAMRRRHLRWSWATIEFLRRFSLPFLRSRARWYEKLDLLLPSVNLPAALLLLAFTGTVQGISWVDGDLSILRDPVVIGLGVFASAAPLAMFVDLWRRPRFAIKVVVLNTLAYLALFPVSVVGVLRGLVRPAEFLVTPKGTTGALSLHRAASESRLEVAFGAGLLAFGAGAFGPWGLVSPLAIAPLLAPLLMTRSRRSLNRTRTAGGTPPAPGSVPPWPDGGRTAAPMQSARESTPPANGR